MDYSFGLYRRGFVLSDKKISLPKPEWKNFEFTPNYRTYYLCYDPITEISYNLHHGKWCLMIGMVMDTIDWHMELDKVCKNLLDKLCNNKRAFYEYLDTLNGRFALFYGDKENVFVLNDATATRSVYYHEKKLIVASHYGLIEDITSEKEHPYYAEYNKIPKNKPWTLPGDLTPFCNIKILTANHEYNLLKHCLLRFYPREDHKQVPLDEILKILPAHLKNQMNTLASYHTPIISVTGGNDSKVTMAAGRDIRDSAVYFTFKNEKTDLNNLDQTHRMQDQEYAQYITELYNLNFKPLILKPPVDDGMKAVMKKNHYHQHIVSAVPEYMNELPEGVHVQSNLIEIIRDLTHVYPKPPKNNSKQEIMAGWMMYWSKRHELKDVFEDYWKRNEWDKIYNFERVRMFYWEHRMSCWNSAATLVENDWAFDTYLLLNCRKLLELGFSIPKYARDINYITKYIVKSLWPELLFRIENSKDTLFDYFEIDSCGKLAMPEELKSRSAVDNALIFKRKYGVMFGFDKLKIEKNDFCEIVFDNTLVTKKYIRLDISTPLKNEIESGLVDYYIKIDNNIVFEKDISSLKGDLQNIILGVGKESFGELSIGIKAESSVDLEDYGTYAVINLESIRQSDAGFNSSENIMII